MHETIEKWMDNLLSPKAVDVFWNLGSFLKGGGIELGNFSHMMTPDSENFQSIQSVSLAMKTVAVDSYDQVLIVI